MIGSALLEALRRLASFDPDLYRIIGLSLQISGTALLLASLLGVPLGAWLALSRFRLKQQVVNVLYALMGLPPVVVGLLVYLLLSRSGPLGGLGLLFTPTAMVVAQFLLALPIVLGLSMVAIDSLDPALAREATALGASPRQVSWLLIAEARRGIFAAVVTALGRVLAEVGAVMLVGGNIKGFTRVMTTAIVLETRQGEFEQALALGFVLVLLALAVNLLLGAVQRGGRARVE
ncbi:MAG: ABC transporter permease [Chitinophagales bacterium]